MDEASQRALEAIGRSRDWLHRQGPVRLDASYGRVVEKLEASPENRSGTDKTWVHRLLLESARLCQAARRR